MRKLILLALMCSVFRATALDDAFHLRKYDTQTLKNGLQILWIPDAGLPYVSFQMMFRSGSVQDPEGKEGLTGFVASMLERGTKNRTAAQVSEELEQIGSGFGASVDADYSIMSASSLSFNKEALLKLYSEILLQPSFTNAEIDRLRKQALGGIQKLPDQTEEFAQNLLPGFLYGPKHPYGHVVFGSLHTIKSFKRADLQNLYTALYTPDNAVLAVVGQYDQAYRDAVVKTFEGWQSKSGKLKEVPDFPEIKGISVLLADRSDLAQAQIVIGAKGIQRQNPDYLEYRAGLKILGESFGSRLFEEIRVKRGLTYGIHAFFEPRVKPGPMTISTFTRVDKIGETVEETIKTYQKFVKDGITDAEVTEAKALMRGQFPRNFETPEALASALLTLNRYGISPDYLTNYLENVQKLTKDKVNAAIKKWYDPENLRIVIYAPKAKVEAALKKIGSVEVKPYKEFFQ